MSWHKNSLHSCLCHYKQLCPICVTWHLKLLMLDTYYNFFSGWAHELLSISYLTHHLNHLAWSIFLALKWLSTWVTRHSLQLGIVYIFTYYTWHELLVWHELSECLNCVDTQLSKPIWEQQSPPLTWVSKTLNCT